MATPFKMKGNPMQRNFGISPLKEDNTSYDLNEEGTRLTEYVDDPNDENSMGYINEYNQLSNEEKVGAKINPKKNVYEGPKGDYRTLSSPKKA
tara:strand:+ start:268 stop:546 length:279 start_codon:yes stop_codon:yes gene_type:complete